VTTTISPVRSETDRPGITPGTARRVTIASFVGTALESYDFYLYAYFAAFFVGPLFFTPLGSFGARSRASWPSPPASSSGRSARSCSGTWATGSDAARPC